MLRRVLVALAALLVVPGLLHAYTIVLKDGRRIEAQKPYVAQGDFIWYEGTDGTSHRIAVAEVDFKATRQANAAQRKVWTNEDLAALRGAPVSVVGRAGGAAAAAAGEGETAAAGEETGEALSPREETARYWQQQLKAVFDQIDAIDRKIESLRSNQGRAASNRIDITTDAEGIQVEDTLRRLEAQKRELQDQVMRLQEQAERKGIAPGKLRRSAVERAAREARAARE